MKQKTKYLSMAALGLVITTALVAGTASASSRNFLKRGDSSADREAINQAIEDNDYNAWRELVGDTKTAEVINEDNFSRLVEMHNLIQAGDTEAANEIREELGLRKIFGDGAKRMNKGFGNNEAAREALDSNNYSAWVEAVGEDCPMLDKINENNFYRLVEAHNLRGQAQTIMEELGVERGRKSR